MRALRFALISWALTGCLSEDPMTTGPSGPQPDSPRVLDGLQALYTFQDGDGLIAHDVSGLDPALDLQLDNLVTNQWLPDGGLQITGPSVITSPDVAERLFVACVTANAVTLEAWIEPENVTQGGPAPILAYAKADKVNVSLAQDTTRYRGDVLTSNPDPTVDTGTIQSIQTDADLAAVAAQHVVYTRDQAESHLYVDGTDVQSDMTPGDQQDWSPAYQLVIGNRTTGGRPWLGKLHLAAIYCRALTPAEVTKNYGAGYTL